MAHFYIGACYENGDGMEKNPTYAFGFYCMAAKEGYVGAHYKIARCYQEGTGVEKDKVTAYLWMSVAAAAEYGDSAKCLEELTKQMTAEQLGEAKRIMQEGKSEKEEKAPEE